MGDTVPTDAQHANTIREKLESLRRAIRDAASDGIEVEMTVGKGHGSQRGKDRTTEFPVPLIKIRRPL